MMLDSRRGVPPGTSLAADPGLRWPGRPVYGPGRALAGFTGPLHGSYAAVKAMAELLVATTPVPVRAWPLPLASSDHDGPAGRPYEHSRSARATRSRRSAGPITANRGQPGRVPGLMDRLHRVLPGQVACSIFWLSRRGYGEAGIYFDHRGSALHKTCSGRWRGVVSLGFDADGKRIRKKVSGQSSANGISPNLPESWGVRWSEPPPENEPISLPPERRSGEGIT